MEILSTYFMRQKSRRPNSQQCALSPEEAADTAPSGASAMLTVGTPIEIAIHELIPR